jgi:hypothetical protein
MDQLCTSLDTLAITTPVSETPLSPPQTPTGSKQEDPFAGTEAAATEAETEAEVEPADMATDQKDAYAWTPLPLSLSLHEKL